MKTHWKLRAVDKADIRLCTKAVTQKVQQHAGKRAASDSEVFIIE